jgi:hypothetical protein
LPGKFNFVPLEQVIGGNLQMLFPGMKVLEHQPFRVTRNADVEMDAEDADDLLQLVEQELRARRMAEVVRVELADTMSPAMRDTILNGLDARPRQILRDAGADQSRRSGQPGRNWICRHCRTSRGLPDHAAAAGHGRRGHFRGHSRRRSFWCIIRTRDSPRAWSDSSMRRCSIPRCRRSR